MKPMAVLLLSFLFISAFTQNPSICAAGAAAPPPVLDVTGEELRAGVRYYIVSAIWGAGGGGLSLASAGNNTCPLDVVQEGSDMNYGLPWTFVPVNPNEGVVRVSTDHNIKFTAATICDQSTVWKVDFDEVLKQYVVTTGGVEGNPGPQTLSNWFKIERSGSHAYKLVFCPAVCDFCKVVCSDLGVYIESGKFTRRLTLRDSSFRVVFFRKLEEQLDDVA